MATIDEIKVRAGQRSRETFLDLMQEYSAGLCKDGEEYQLLSTRYNGVASVLIRDIVSGHVVKVHNVHNSPTYMDRRGDIEIGVDGDDLIVNGGE